jgi:vancomycin permeability regulator SanA
MLECLTNYAQSLHLFLLLLLLQLAATHLLSLTYMVTNTESYSFCRVTYMPHQSVGCTLRADITKQGNSKWSKYFKILILYTFTLVMS